MRIGSHIHVEVVAKEIAVPVRVPSPVTVWLGIVAFAVTGITAMFLAVADSLFALLRSGADRNFIPARAKWTEEINPL